MSRQSEKARPGLDKGKIAGVTLPLLSKLTDHILGGEGYTTLSLPSGRKKDKRVPLYNLGDMV